MAANVNTAALERARLAALTRTGLLDSAAEPLFDLITALAAKAVNVPVVLMSLVASDRQFFKSQHGLPAPVAAKRETPLSHSFCQYVAVLGEPLIVEDAREHPLVRENLAIPDFGVLAYAGMPLTTKEGFTLGSLCAIDTQPRQWTSAELEILRDFAAQIMAEIELRAQVIRLDENLETLRASARDRHERIRHVVHDLRTPLNALIIGLEGLALTGSLNSEQHECFDLARRNADVLRALVQHVIEISALEGSTDLRTRCLPHEIVDRALDQVLTLAEKAKVHLQSDDVVPVPAISVRAGDLTRVLVNLIANGVKFTPAGGTVRVSISEENEKGLGVVRFTVRDTGIGIAPEDQQRIFREGVRLNRSASAAESTGIGLAFCKHVVEENGGQLSVESQPGAGSTFSFNLPIDRSPQPAGLVGK
ncbi:MAG: GAF domain-containing sensor histidine kinase [Chthoniobacterales bacterium]